MPGEIFASSFSSDREGQHLRALPEGDVEIIQGVRSLSMVKDFSNYISLLNISQVDLQLLMFSTRFTKPLFSTLNN